MNHTKKIGNSQIREDHKTKVLNYIRINNAVSRTDIYKSTNISKPTVTRVIEQLLEEGLVIEGGTAAGESDVGRRPVYVQINPSAYYCVGVNISKSAIQASIIDLSMNIIYKKTTSIKRINGVDDFKHIVLSCINEILGQVNNIDRSKILGIGIGVPGTVDYNKGTIMTFASKPDIVDVNLKDFIEEELKLQVFIDNNAKTRALGEYWYGYGIGYKNIIFVVCSEGIGSGIITDGNLLRGKNNVTGEFGQMIINVDGGFNSVEACCALGSVESSVKALLKQGNQSVLIDLAKGDIESIDYKLICKGAAKGDLLCIEQLKHAASILSIGLVNTIQIVNPEIIILSGELFDESEYFYELVKEYTRDRLLNILTQDTVFARRKVVDGLYEIGAATLIYKRFFQD
ncbi:ROK family transcriptional regulator [Clostridium swellfunianum]|uniref:ROK family transcriptional regulator n=1 Tax=Clostridium swellfunianum TaxID=1367462 RepID=UPI00202ED127|nr:ROK family transcriptional regulator [Clostridium swellfunianum]MCM0649964.1 ROK family transcriptional regulator [Clostridium swellfunianum]